MQVSQGELVEYLVSASQQYGMEPSEFIQTLEKGGQIPAMVGEVARSKALAVALRQIEVKDSDGNVVDLSEYIGSDENDEAQAALNDAVAQAQAAGDAEVDAPEPEAAEAGAETPETSEPTKA